MSDADRLTDRLPGRESDDERTRVGAVGVAVAAIGLVALGGSSGVAFAAGLAIAWVLLSATYAFALGQVAVVALAPAGFTPAPGSGLLGVASAAVAEAGLFGVLLAPAIRLADTGQSVALASAWALVGGALAWASAGAGSSVEPWLAGLVLVVSTALAAYVMHRYQLVSLGLVDGSDGGDSDAPTGLAARGGVPDEQ